MLIFLIQQARLFSNILIGYIDFLEIGASNLISGLYKKLKRYFKNNHMICNIL